MVRFPPQLQHFSSLWRSSTLLTSGPLHTRRDAPRRLNAATLNSVLSCNKKGSDTLYQLNMFELKSQRYIACYIKQLNHRSLFLQWDFQPLLYNECCRVRADNGEKCLALVNAVISFWVPKYAKTFLPKDLLNTQEWLCSM